MDSHPVTNPGIRPIVICLFSRDGKILVAESFDPAKNEVFYRPLGGGIEFGETAVQALARELHEELGAAVHNLKYLFTLENIFTFNGQPGHEIVLVYDGAFVDESLYARPVLIGQEDPHDEGPLLSQPQSSLRFEAVWKTLPEIVSESRPLYPDALLERLSEL